MLAAVACHAEDPAHEPSLDDSAACASCGLPSEPTCAPEKTAPAPCFFPLSTYDGATELSISVAWSPIDDFVLSGAAGELRLLELTGDASFRELAIFRDQGGRIDVAWSPDGRFALSASTDVRLLAVDRATGSIAQIAPALTPNAGDIYALAWAPDGTAAVSVGQDGVARLLGVDTAAGSLDELASFAVGGGKTFDVAFSPDGALFAIANANRTLVIVSVDLENRSLAEVARIEEDGWVTAVAWSPTDDAVLSGTWLSCNTVLLSSFERDRSALVTRSRFRGHTSGVRVLAFNPAGDRAVSAGHDDTLRLFDVSTTGGTLSHLATWDENALGVHDVSFSPDGSRLLVAASHADHLTLLDVSACVP
ncbi:MAG TPA: WD40 repeat domain-containing protein [Polyangiaceae bacterium]|nr:WD40 repeat domain-containing protein [Polyangiaceae bacterium]